MRQYLRATCEFLPLSIFFILYYFSGILIATKGLIIASLLVLLIVFIIERKVSAMLVISNLALIIFGSITIYTSNTTFIMIKPTILYLIFTAILCYDILKRKQWMRHIFGKVMILDEETCIKISKQWCCFFICCAFLNEVIWRNFSIDTWVNFKVFGFLSLTIMMSFMQLFFLRKKVSVDK